MNHYIGSGWQPRLSIIAPSPWAGLQGHPRGAGSVTRGVSIPSPFPDGAQRWVTFSPRAEVLWALLCYPLGCSNCACTWLSTWRPSFSLSIFLPWLMYQFPVLVTGVGSTWPRVLACSCQLPPSCPGHSSSQDPWLEPCDLWKTSQTPSASFIPGALPAPPLCCWVLPTCRHSPKLLPRPLPISPWLNPQLRLRYPLDTVIYTLGWKHRTVCLLPAPAPLSPADSSVACGSEGRVETVVI